MEETQKIIVLIAVYYRQNHVELYKQVRVSVTP
jgi:hypothetical protein